MSLSWPKSETGPQEPAKGDASPVRSVYRRQTYTSPFPYFFSCPTFRESVGRGILISAQCAVLSFHQPDSVQSVFVGSKSWITVYHADLAPSDVGMLWRLFHTFSHSIPGWTCVKRSSRGGVAVVAMLLRVPYARRLKCWSVSSCLLGLMYANSMT